MNRDDAFARVFFGENGEMKLIDRNDPELAPIMEATGLVRRERKGPDGKTILEISKNVTGGGFVQLGFSKEWLDRAVNAGLQATIRRFQLVGLIAILVGLLLAHLLSTALSHPINQLMKAAVDIANGKKGVQLQVRSNDELGHLTRTFNHMSNELAKLDELKDDFMSHVTHELRSPLTSIIATVGLMSEMPMAIQDPKMKRSIDRLVYGSERLNKLVDNILDLTRMEAGRMSFDVQPFNIGPLITEMCDFFVPRAQEKNLKIKALVPSAPLLAQGDGERIRQVLSNLIHNAIKFTNEGGIVVWAREHEGWAQIGVQDTGVGIPKDKLLSVFEKFQTLQDTRNRVDKPVPGSGLGLNIVKNSIQAQGGRVWVHSEMNKGSTFFFTLPLAARADNKVAPKLTDSTFMPMAIRPQEILAGKEESNA
jgi:two-component system sensor histidine kinase GlrK